MKKRIGLALVSILLFLFLVACGIPQDEYDKVSSNLTTAQILIRKLQSDLTVKNSALAAKDAELKSVQTALSEKDTELKSTQGALVAKETELKSAQNALSDKETELKSAEFKMGLAKNKIEVINDIFLPAIKGDLANLTEAEITHYFFLWQNKVNAIGDSELSTQFQTFIDKGGSQEATTAFLVYLLESIPKALE
jgi:hypothetical protein